VSCRERPVIVFFGVRSNPLKNTCDFLVIGSGIAGLTYALHAARYGTVIIITKKHDSESNTNYAQGGIACVLDPADSFESHVRDTLVAGAGLCNEQAVRILVEEGPQRIKELLAWGARFTKSRKSKAFGNLELGREGGHTANRIVHARDLTGKELERSLLHQAKRHPNITFLENHYAVDLITLHHLPRVSSVNTCFGAFVLDTQHRRIFTVDAKITCLSSGGVGQVYLHTTNPAIATGDGLAAAYRAGAEVANMEFMQFHPTTLFHPEANRFLISEALRGFGAILRGRDGKEFMDKYHPMGSLAPRDIVARAIDSEMKLTGEPSVFLDIRHAPAAKTRTHFPNIYRQCMHYGIDITKDLIPVVPAAHYMCGGLRVDLSGETTIHNLYACGEVSCTGVHGANRLASNSLLEALVFSRRAASDGASRLSGIGHLPLSVIPAWDDSGTIATEEWILLAHNIHEVKSVMWDYVGIVRSNVRLARALRRVSMLEKETEEFYKRTKITPELLELRNIVAVAKLIVLSAQKRRESRGLHYTTDFPELDDRSWKKDTILRNPVRR
jgi:L-aspartate oxidase